MKEDKKRKEAEQARIKAIRQTTDKFVKEVLKDFKTTVFNRKVLRNLIRKFVGNKNMQPVMNDLQDRYNIQLVGW